MQVESVELSELLSTGVVARMLGVSSQAVSQWVAEGKLACRKTRLGRLFERSDVEAFAQERAARLARRHRDEA